MADQLQLRRGTTAQNLLFTGAQGEVIVDTDKNTLVVHNGSTAGGFPLASSKQLSDSTFYYNEDAGSAADAYILTPKANTSVPSAYLGGIQFGFITTHPNTGPSTANFQGLGVKALKFPGGVDPLAGELSGRVYLIYDEANGWLEIQRKASGAPPQLRTINATVGSNILTVTLAPCTIDFRSSSIGSGVVNTRNVSSTLSLAVPNGATLGTVNAVSSRLVLLALYGPVNVELGIINQAGGINLDETGVINTVAISAASTAANVVYSITARAGIPYRVVGFLDSNQPTAGAWSTLPTTVQGAGGQALSSLSALSGFGFGQTWQNFTGSRVAATTYTNSTNKPIMVSVVFTGSGGAVFGGLTINGVQVAIGSPSSAGVPYFQLSGVVPPGSTYSAQITSATINTWYELRT